MREEEEEEGGWWRVMEGNEAKDGAVGGEFGGASATVSLVRDADSQFRG